MENNIFSFEFTSRRIVDEDNGEMEKKQDALSRMSVGGKGKDECRGMQRTLHEMFCTCDYRIR
jgi:hypothetical protein